MLNAVSTSGSCQKNFTKQQSWVAKCHVFYIKHSSGSKVAWGEKKKEEENVIKTLTAVRNIFFPHGENVWAMSWWDRGSLFLFRLKAPLSLLFCTPPPEEWLFATLPWRTLFRLASKSRIVGWSSYIWKYLPVDFGWREGWLNSVSARMFISLIWLMSEKANRDLRQQNFNIKK